MKNYFIIFFILILIVLTSLIKSSTRELESQIYTLEEDVKTLSDKKDLILLENNFLSSPDRLFYLKKILFGAKKKSIWVFYFPIKKFALKKPLEVPTIVA